MSALLAFGSLVPFVFLIAGVLNVDYGKRGGL